MTIKIFHSSTSTWKIAQTVKVYYSSISDWVTAKKISAWRGEEATGYWDIIYPDLPFSTSTPNTVTCPVAGATLFLSNYFIWDFSAYRNPDTITYQWQRSLNEGVWSNISGATAPTYVAELSDVGYNIRCRITGTNEKGSTEVFSNAIAPIENPNYTFQFGNELGVNANARIILDKEGASFPFAGYLDDIPGRVIGYFLGNYKIYRIWYKSDTTNFRLYVQMYRDDQTSQASIEYEIVFTNNSNVVDIYVVNPVSTDYIVDYFAYRVGGCTLKNHSSSLYAGGKKFRVTLDYPTIVSVTTESASTTSPGYLDGWIDLNQYNNFSTATLSFSSGLNLSSPIAPGVNGAFTKSNMFFPTTPTIATPSLISSTSSSISWSGSNANGYYVKVTNNANSTIAFSQFTTGTSVTATGLSLGSEYTVEVSPISRSDYAGQYGFASTKIFYHAQPPGAVQNLSASNAAQPFGESGGITWTISWNAPSSDGGAPITGYEYASDIFGSGYGAWTSVSGTNSHDGLTLSYFRAKYKIRAVNDVGAGPETEIQLIAAATKPGTPSANVNTTNAQISVNWTASNLLGGSSLKYKLYRGQNSANLGNAGSGTLRNNIAQSSTSFTDSINEAATYYYKVVPESTIQTSPNTFVATGIRSDISSGTTTTYPSVNTPAVNISNTVKGLNINWSGNTGSGNTLTYRLYRGQNSSGLVNYGSGNLRTNQTSTSYSGDSADSGVTYYYRVDGSNNLANANSGVSAGITTPTGPNAPGRPSGTANNANNQINVSWGAATGRGTINYALYRGQNPTNLAVTGAGTLRTNQTSTSFTDSYGSTATYYYRVDATDLWGTRSSNVSNGISAS